jgi:hypothetical protein
MHKWINEKNKTKEVMSQILSSGGGESCLAKKIQWKEMRRTWYVRKRVTKVCFFFRILLDLQRNCEYSTANSHVYFICRILYENNILVWYDYHN